MPDTFLHVRRGISETYYFDCYTDDSHTTRQTLDGWRCVIIVRQPSGDVTWATDDDSPKLTVVDATSPTGKRLRLILNADDTRALTAGRLFMLRIDPDDPTNVGELGDSVRLSLAAPP